MSTGAQAQSLVSEGARVTLRELEPLAEQLGYFPKDYASARARFRETSAVVKRESPDARVEVLAVPSRIDLDLTIDSLYLPPTRATRKLLLISSGVHGPEGFT